MALALALAFAVTVASTRAVAQALQISTSGGRTQGLLPGGPRCRPHPGAQRLTGIHARHFPSQGLRSASCSREDQDQDQKPARPENTARAGYEKAIAPALSAQ